MARGKQAQRYPCRTEGRTHQPDKVTYGSCRHMSACATQSVHDCRLQAHTLSSRHNSSSSAWALLSRRNSSSSLLSPGGLQIAIRRHAVETAKRRIASSGPQKAGRRDHTRLARIWELGNWGRSPLLRRMGSAGRSLQGRRRLEGRLRRRAPEARRRCNGCGCCSASAITVDVCGCGWDSCGCCGCG